MFFKVNQLEKPSFLKFLCFQGLGEETKEGQKRDKELGLTLWIESSALE